MTRRRRKPLLLDRRAEAEVEHATDYLEGERAGLGRVFQAALHATLDRIVALPTSFQILMKPAGPTVRGATVRPFSYRVVYVELPEALRVVALAHMKQRPGYWRDRLDALEG